MKEKALATARKLKEMGITLDDIIMMFEEIDKENFKNEEILIEILKEAGITSNYIGYECLIEAIKLYSINPKLLLVEEVYPTIGKKLGMKPNCVERNLRTIVHRICAKNPEFCEKIMGESFLKFQNKPTNKRFIFAITKYYQSKKKTIKLKTE